MHEFYAKIQRDRTANLAVLATRRLGLIRPRAGAITSLEDMLTRADLFGLTTATPVQRAICRAADGLDLGDLCALTGVRAAFCDQLPLAGPPPSEMHILSGIRTGKSLIAAALAVRASQSCDVSRLGPGEIPRVSVVSLKLDLARVVRDHLVGHVEQSAILRAILLEEPGTDSVLLRHPSGRPIEVKIVAGARAGASLVARWSAGAIFDEAARMVGVEDGVINYDDARAAVLGRLLPGAQLVTIGSPWAPFGPIYDLVQERWGKPQSDGIVIVRANAAAMHPQHWTPERIAELRARDERVYRTDVLGEFADVESALLATEELMRCVRADAAALPRVPGHHYVAAMDPGTRGNAWTVVLGSHDGERLRVALARQWVGSVAAPLSPDAVLFEIASICRDYGVTSAQTDQYAADALRDLAVRHGLWLRIEVVSAQSKLRHFDGLRALIADGRVSLPNDPTLLDDLRRVRRLVTQAGVSIRFPQTADGRHCDYAPALAMLAAQIAPAPDAATEPELTPEETQQAEYAAQLVAEPEDAGEWTTGAESWTSDE